MLLNAIKEYEANKWKVIGQKVGKPAKVSFPYSPTTPFYLCNPFRSFPSAVCYVANWRMLDYETTDWFGMAWTDGCFHTGMRTIRQGEFPGQDVTHTINNHATKFLGFEKINSHLLNHHHHHHQ